MNPLQQLAKQGQSIWLDFMRRSLVTTGELQRLIENDGLKGLTSNPTIFQKAVEGSEDYDDLFAEWAPRECGAGEVFEALAVRDIGDAARDLPSGLGEDPAPRRVLLDRGDSHPGPRHAGHAWSRPAGCGRSSASPT